MITRWDTLLCVLVFRAFFPTLNTGADWQGRVTVTDGVQYAENPSTPLCPPAAITLEEHWRLGGNSAKEGEFFGVIADVAVGAAGEAFLLDSQLANVRVFSAQGRYLRTIGREGEGPGEFRRPTGILFLPDGRLAVIQSQPPRLVLLETDGTPAGTLKLVDEDEGYRLVREGASRGGSLVLLGNSFRFLDNSVERTRHLFGVDAGGRSTTLFAETTFRHVRGRPVICETESFAIPWALGPDGTVFASLTFDYRVQSWRADGSSDRIITRICEPYVRSKKEREDERRRLGASVRIRGPQGRIEPEVEVSERDRAIRWLAVDDSGYLWVLPGRSVRTAPAGVVGPFDVFDAEGRYLQAVTLRGEANLDEDRIFKLGDRIFVLTQYASAYRTMLGNTIQEADGVQGTEPMSVICYRLEWAPPVSPSPREGQRN